MKKIFSIISLAMCLIFPLQAQIAPISKNIVPQAQKTMKRVAKAKAQSDITINDMVGTFAAYGMSAFQGYPDERWSMNFTLDATDANKLWIQPIMQIPGVNMSDVAPIYAIYSQENATLTIPLGQRIYGDGTQYDIVIATVDEAYDPVYTGDLVVNVTGNPKSIFMELDLIFGCGNLAADEWWYQALGYMTISKQLPLPKVYVVCQDGKNIIVNTEELYFVDVDGEMYVATTPEVECDPIAGSYSAYANSAFEGNPDEMWTVNITYDEVDPTKVWIQPIMLLEGLEENKINPVYGTFNASNNSLVVPLGQVLYGAEGGEYCFVLGSTDQEYNPVTNGNLVLEVKNVNGKNTIEIPYIIGMGNLSEGDAGWWYQALGYTVFTSNSSALCPLSEVDIITREAPAPDFEGFFTSGNYDWDFEISSDGEVYDAYTSTTKLTYEQEVDLGNFYDGAQGVIAHQWSVSGFMNDLGFFGEDGASASFPAFSYNFILDGVNHEFFDVLDPQTGVASIGSVMLTDQSGSKFSADVYLGEYDGDNLYTNLQFVVNGNKAEYQGTSMVLWFLIGETPYLLADFKNVTISMGVNDEAAAPMQVNVYEKPIAVKMAGVKAFEYKK